MSSNERVRKLERELEETQKRLRELTEAFHQIQNAIVAVGAASDEGLDAAGKALGDVTEVLGFFVPPEVRERLPPEARASLKRLLEALQDIPDEPPSEEATRH